LHDEESATIPHTPPHRSHPRTRAPGTFRSATRLSLVIPALPSHLLFRAALLALGALPAVPRALDSSATRTPAVEAPGIVAGSYVAVLANGQKLPWTTQVPAVQGLAHWARLDLAVLRLTADGRYTLSYRYAQEIVDTRAPLRMPPARDELSVGRYLGKGKKLTFVPKVVPGRAERTVTADVVGEDISLDKTVLVGERPFRVKLLFRRDPSLW
jgi:hypothetical protein